MDLLNKNKKILIFSSAIIFIIFLYSTIKTPLAGDDWGYALNGMHNNSFQMACDFYVNWSGRFFSELWGFLIAPHKFLWNIINPLLFTGIFVLMYLLIDNNNNNLLIAIMLITGIFTISADLRMETYSWIMGTTYVIPLFLSLLYFYLIYKSKMNNIIKNILSNICLFIIGLMMENIAAAMILAIAILIIKYYCDNKKISIALIINLLISVISFVIMRMSPGSTARLLRDYAEWNELSLWKKFATSYDNFLFQTFIKNKFSISIFCLCLILLMLFSKKRINSAYKMFSIFVSILCVFSLFSYMLLGKENVFNDHLSWFSFFFWPIFIANSFISLFVGCKDNFKITFFLLLAGASAFAMCFSPLYEARSTLYLVYYVLLVSGCVISEIDINRIIYYLCFSLFILLICIKIPDYCYKYYLVGKAQGERLEVIKYYQDHPEDEDVWIERFPIYTVHGADIEPDDVYHLETFRDYYKLPQDYKNIHFANKE